MSELPESAARVRDEMLPNMCNWCVMGTVGDDPKLPYMKHAWDAGYFHAIKSAEKLYVALELSLKLDNKDYQCWQEWTALVLVQKEALAQWKGEN
jgi:hypothetical protein